jgi:hypothetical protein
LNEWYLAAGFFNIFIILGIDQPGLSTGRRKDKAWPPVGNRGWVSYWGIERCFGCIRWKRAAADLAR